MESNTYLIVHTDYRFELTGPNGGAETATIAEAKFLRQAGKKVFVCGIFSGSDIMIDGISFINAGPSYNIERAITKVSSFGPYHLLGVGKAFALYLAQRDEHCISRILISHDQGATESGFRPEILTSFIDCLVCVSRAQQKTIVDKGFPLEKSVVVYNGVDQEIFYPGATNQRDYSKLVFSGALVPDKGLHLLISSFVALRQVYPNLTLDVYGSASLWNRAEYMNISELATSIPGLVFHGKVDQLTVANAFRSAGICVVPSIWFDSFPFAVIEAQVCGCPVVGFPVGGIPEGIESGVTGLVLDEISESSLRNGLHRLLADSQMLHRMSIAAAAIAPPRFRWHNTVGSLIAVAENVVISR